MAIRMLLVLLTLTGPAPAAECTCASAHHATDSHQGDEPEPVAFVVQGAHGHDDSHPIHHHPTCPAINPQLGPPVALVPAPFSVPVPSDAAFVVWGMGSPDPSSLCCCIRLPSHPSARALPLYLSQSALQI